MDMGNWWEVFRGVGQAGGVRERVQVRVLNSTDGVQVGGARRWVMEKFESR